MNQISSKKCTYLNDPLLYFKDNSSSASLEISHIQLVGSKRKERSNHNRAALPSPRSCYGQQWFAVGVISFWGGEVSILGERRCEIMDYYLI